MPVHLNVTWTTSPGKGAELAASMKPRVEQVLKEPGCERYEVFVGAHDDSRVVLLERWSDAAALEVHMAVKDYPPFLRELITAPSDVQRFET